MSCHLPTISRKESTALSDIKVYKCPCCGAPVQFDASLQDLHCSFCDSDFTAESLQKIEDAANAGAPIGTKYDWSTYEPRDYTAEDSINLASYSCPSCGAEVTGDENLGATVCPYCGGATIVKKQFEGALRPDYLIPFSVTKEQAMQSFERASLKAPFLPKVFKDKRKIEEMSGVYVPFWMFDCNADADVTYKATRTSFWSDRDYNYTKTDYYRVKRQGSLGFANIPVDGSKKADDAYMEALAPFDFTKALAFNSAYLAGYLADRYDVTADECRERANQRVKESTESAFASTVNGYESVVPEETNVSFSNGKIRYALLPVWMLCIRYDGAPYRYAINGQTGKCVGVYPIDKTKKWLYFARVAGIALVAALAIAWFLFLR